MIRALNYPLAPRDCRIKLTISSDSRENHENWLFNLARRLRSVYLVSFIERSKIRQHSTLCMDFRAKVTSVASEAETVNVELTAQHLSTQFRNFFQSKKYFRTFFLDKLFGTLNFLLLSELIASSAETKLRETIRRKLSIIIIQVNSWKLGGGRRHD